MQKLSKKFIIILFIFLIVIICGAIYWVFNRNVRKINFDNIEKIHINYYSYEDASNPIISVELNEYEKEKIISNLQKVKFIEYDSTPRGSSNYEVLLDDNTKFTFSYEADISNWFDNRTEENTKLMEKNTKMYKYPKVC